MSAPVTQTFHGVNPVHVGVYQRRYNTGGRKYWLFCWWNGRSFGYGAKTPAIAADRAGTFGVQNLPWRGLAENPAKAKP